MDRRHFMKSLAVGSAAAASGVPFAGSQARPLPGFSAGGHGYKADLVIAGGGLGGCAAALGALRSGLRVVMTEETDWIGGQLSQQGVPPDEHQWIETHGATARYRSLRQGIRDYYRKNYPLTAAAAGQQYLNPGNGAVSRLCHEPSVAVAVLQNMMAAHLSSGRLTLLTRHKVTRAETSGDRVTALQALDLRNGQHIELSAPYFVDATELGDLLPMTGTEHGTGTESADQTGELHAPGEANPDNQQAFTLCFAMDYVPGGNHTIEKPENYSFWRSYVPDMDPPWPGELLNLRYSNPRTLKPKQLGFDPEGAPTGEALNLWNYRRIIDRANFQSGVYTGDITVVNWPQNDYTLGGLIGPNEAGFGKNQERGRHNQAGQRNNEAEFEKSVDGARQLNLSLLYWLQTEAPRPDGRQGWPGLRLRSDVMGTRDGMAKYPYVRESRRIKAVFTVLEEHVGAENRKLVAGEKAGNNAASFHDSVGTGYYHIDLHPGSGGANYVDFASLPFEIPLGALLPVRTENLLPAAKNIGTTHITNGCYRLHPVEWNIGEAAGLLVAFSIQKQVPPRAVREQPQLLKAFQKMIRAQGVATNWPS